ncbi:Fe-S cluster assembly ATPase SufC [Faecalicatena contorta]|uniref:Iron-regulated ABC transporter ATPase subunit SufC n=1 Tax=Faecalicatena contorta TaxID=39482 RepID=A0A316A4I3_9FIRM|nr:Fe-S cluster assembly ATPase SufC [Faecalicatena contorta]PWJ51850.1 iron-regulated ABC transporter ATPase subunit SufC [Faecalicatena contorta]SUQ12088.1 Iron-regulated ABC transporter ATPase subunit SufC [Faecalicatena contorta]
MSKLLLKVQNLHASVEDKVIIKGLDLQINEGEVHVIMGPNGAGKSTLANIIMGHPNYKVTEGSICFEGEDITEAKTDERAKKGLFLSFQAPEEISGITMENFMRSSKAVLSGHEVKAYAFHKELMLIMDELQMDKNYAARHVNVGFSGGEKKKSEILQMLVLNPKLAILDETDSGLDVDAVKTVSSGINQFKNSQNAILIITHNTKILDKLHADFVHVLMDGKIVKTGGTALIDQIYETGFASMESFSGK